MKKFYAIFFATLFVVFNTCFGQSIISPVDGGFEQPGSTLAANGWTSVNSLIGNNHWEVGSAIYKPGGGNKSAYISTDGGTTNDYDNTTAQVSHFYRDVAIPAGTSQAILEFYMHGDYGPGADRLEVWIDPSPTSANKPVPDALPGGTAVNWYTQGFANMNPNYTYQGMNLTGYKGTTIRIIFTWINGNGSGPTNPPASIDGVLFCIAPVAYNVTGGGNFCAGDAGLHVGLSNSDLDVNYQLYSGATPVGSPVAGTGSAIDFGILATAGTYTVKGTSIAPCNLTTNMSGSATVAINPLPTADAGLDFSITCAQSPTGKVIGEANDALYTYSWSPSTDLSSATVSNPFANPSITTTYTVTKTRISTGCFDTDDITITVDKSAPVVNITGSNSICIGSTTTLSPTTGGTWSSSDPAAATVTSAGIVTAVSAGSATFTFTATANGCSSTTAAVTVKPTPVGSATPASQTICSGEPSNIALNSTESGTTFTWTAAVQTAPSGGAITGQGGGSGTSIAQTLNNSGTTAGVIRYTVTPTVNGCPGANFTVDVTVNPIPVGSAADQTICSGATSSVALNSTVSGTSFTWTTAVQTAPSGGSITGHGAGSGTSIAQTLINSGTTAGVIRYTVTPTANTCPGSSFTVDVTINPTPLGSGSPESICSGSSSSVTLNSTVSGTTFTWAAAIQTTPSGGTITGHSAGSGTTIAQTLNNSGTTAGVIRYSVTPTANTCPGAIFTVDVTINPQPGGSASPQTICSGATSNVALNSTVSGTTYTWTAAIQTVPSGGTITGFANGSGTPIAQTLTNTGTTAGVVRYSVTPSISGCPNAVFTVDVTVNPTPAVNALPDLTFCNSSATGAINFTGPVSGTNYSWTNTNTTIGLGGSGAGNIATFTATNAVTAPISSIVTVTPSYTNGVTCTGTAVPFTIIVNPTAVISTSNAPQVVCNGATTAAITFSSSASGGTVTYSWINDNTSIGLAAGPVSGNVLPFVAVNNGTAPVTATVTATPIFTNTAGVAASCPGTTKTFAITVNPTPTVDPVSSFSVCNGSNTPVITFTGNAVSGVVYNWNNDNTLIGLGGSGAGNIPSFSAQNSGASDLVANITVIPRANLCNGSPQTFSITVNPTPSVNTPSDVTYCNNASGAGIVLSTPTAGVQSFNWTSTLNVGFGTSGTGNIPAFTASNTNTPPNTPNSPVTASVSVRATVDGCQSPAANFTVRVNPTPVVTAISNLTYCNNDAAPQILFSSPTTGGTITYDWTSTVNVGFGLSGTGTILAYTATNATNAPITTTMSVRATVNGCQGPAMTFTITVNPTPAVNAVTPVTICAGAPGSAITFSSPTTPAPVFSWTSSVNVGFGTSGSGNIPAYTAANATNTAVTATVTVTATVNGCSGSTSFIITVNPTPAINALTNALCSYSTFTTTPADGTDGIVPAGTVYTWATPALQASVTTVGTSTGTNQTSISGILRNSDSSFTTGAPHTATYTVTPTAGTCVGASFQLVVTVNPVPRKTDASFFQDYTSNIQQICDGKQVGGGGQNDIDVLWAPGPPTPPGGRPAQPYYENNGYEWDWEYSTGPTSAGPYESSPGTVSTFYQHVMPPSPSVFSALGDHYIRFRLTKYGCSNYSDTVNLKIVSTLTPEAGGPYIKCNPAGTISLTGATITGTASSTVTGTWSVIPVGSNGATLGGTLSSTAPQTVAANGTVPTVTFTPTAGGTGIAKLLLTSNDPDGAGALTCNPVFDTCYVVVLPSGNLLGCLDPTSQWLLTQNGGNGSRDISQAPCAAALVGSDNGSTPSASPINTDLTICSGAGNFIFNWAYTSLVPVSPTPVCNSADTRSASGTSGTSLTVARPLNLVANNLILVTLHFRRNPGTINAPSGFTQIGTTVTTGTQTNANNPAVAVFWKTAGAGEPANYTFTISNTNTSNWRISASRITGQNVGSPIDASISSATSLTNSITVPSVNTTVKNSLLVFAQSVISNISAPNTNQLGMTTIYNSNTQTSARVATQTIAPTGPTGNRVISWSSAAASAAEMFVIKPAVTVSDIDSAFAIINGVETFLSANNGDLGTFSAPVTSGSSVGFRVRTTSNTGGAGTLTFYQVNVPNDTPKVVGLDTIKIVACNPATPSSSFVTPTVSNSCGVAVSLKSMTTSAVSSVNCVFKQTRTWIYQKACGLESLPFNQTIVWTQDATAPVVTPPPAQAFCFTPGNNYTVPPATFTDNSCSGTKTITYAITGATTRVGTGANASGTFNIGNSTITWTATDSCGNVDGTKTTAVTVYNQATATLSGNASICPGSSTNLTVTFTGTSPWSITYTDGTTPVTINGINTSPYFINVSPAATTSYSLTAFSSIGSCPGAFSGSAVVTVRPLPTATITTSGPSIICAGGSAILSIAPTGTAPWVVEYTDGFTTFTTPSIAVSPYTELVSPTTTTTYSITKVTDNFGCINNGPFGDVTVTVNSAPVITITPPTAVICAGNSVVLTAGGASTYVWSPATNLSSAVGATVTASPTSTRTYTVTGTSAAGCVGSETITITVTTPLVVTGVNICQGDPAGSFTTAATCADGSFTSPPHNAATVVNNQLLFFNDWINPGNISTPGSPYASNSISSFDGSSDLQATNYGFAIPGTATILGITVDIRRTTTDATGTGDVQDYDIYLLKGGTITGTTTVFPSTATWPYNGTFQVATYGGPTELWGDSWTPADINNANFGFGLKVANFGADAANPLIDYIQIKVTYTVPGSLDWYTVSSGGTSFGSGAPFNPVGVTGSGLDNTNTPGTYTFYAECTSVPGCRTAVDYIINGPVVGGTLTAPSICAGAPNTLTLSGYTGNVVQWERSTNGGSTWNIIANTTNSLVYTATSSQVLYRVLVQSGTCGNAYSNVAMVGIHNMWTGGTSIDWNTGSNWADGQVPNLSCPNVVIQAGTPFQPTLGSGIATINNLIINSTAALTMAGAKLQLAGAITNNGTFNALNGTLEFNGTGAAQNISGAWFVNKTVNSLMVSNANGINVTGAATDSLKIIDSLSFGNVNNSAVNTGDHIVLVSAATTTARVSDITNGGVNSGNHFNGKVTVQRFYPGNRSWRLVTAPLSNTGNIYDSWQNSGVYDVGKGMFVTGPNPTAANGLDNSAQNNYSMKGWDIATQNYANVGDSKATLLSGNAASAANKGFFTFVRGDRSRTPDNTIIPNTNNTTLSSNGNLQTGTQAFAASAVANGFAMIGNPYASPVDFSKLGLSNVLNRFTAWDPLLNDVGGFVVVTGGVPTPASPGGQNNIIQSSQAFFVQTTANGAASVTFNEQHKSKLVSFGMFRPLPAASDKKLLVNLYKFKADNSRYLADGTLTEFGDDYNAAYDIDDAPKFINLNETFGLLRNNKWLAIEQRPTIKETDTLFFKLTKTIARKYQLELKADNLEQDNLAGFVEDSYLNKLTPMYMKGITTVDFEVTSDAASAAQTRFRVIFNPSVTYTYINASVVKNDIAVNWSISSEFNIREYQILRSTDSINFSKAGTLKATGNDHNAVAYQWLDIAPATGYYYYRIRSISNNEVTGNSSIVKVKLNRTSPGMYVFPNPVTNGIIQLQMNNMSAGVYAVRLINNLGQEILNKRISHGPGTATEIIRPHRKITTGNYHLEVLAPDKKVTVININVQ